MTDWNKFKIKPGMLLLHPKTGITAIITGASQDDRMTVWWWILDSTHHYPESEAWLRSYLRRGEWRIIQEVENEAE